MSEKYKLIKYEDKGVIIDVRFDFEKNTIWLTQSEISEIFMIDKSVVSRLLRDASTVAYDAIVQIEGNRHITRKTKLYNLDMIEAISLVLNQLVVMNLLNGQEKNLMIQAILL